MKFAWKTSPQSKRHWYIFSFFFGLTLLLTGALLYAVTMAYHFVYQDAPIELLPTTPESERPPFPIGVNPTTQEITELATVDTYLTEELQSEASSESHSSAGLTKKVVAHLTHMNWFQNLAAGNGRILMIQPGERKEQIAHNIGKILEWDEGEERTFIASIVSTEPVALEGKFAPGSYVVSRDATPEYVASLILTRFDETVLSRYTNELRDRVPFEDALTIASLLEREAYDFTDMRYISGVIWNRLFIDMHLQIDATLQYARGAASLRTWWPTPLPKDKYIESPYNTYDHKGLPPAPIANPSLEAILAALNPRDTDCLYYFHDDEGGFHCTQTYEEHVALLKKFYGRGR